MDVCNNNELNNALRYDTEVYDLYALFVKKNNSRTWYNRFRLDESGLNKRLNSFYKILYSRFYNFGYSVSKILRKYKLESFQFNEYCYFQALVNIYIIIKKKYSNNVFIIIFSSIDDAIVKVYLFFLVKYFNDYISRYKDMLVKKGNHQKKAIKINNKNILLNTYNTTYNSIINNSIRDTNNRSFMIREDYEPYKLCIIFYERFYKVYVSLLKFLYENSYDNIEESDFYLSIQKLKNRIDKLHYLLVETVTGRIQRNKQRKLEHQQLIEQQKLEEKDRKAREALLPPPPRSWTMDLNQRDLYTMGNINNNELKRRQATYEESLARAQLEISNTELLKGDFCWGEFKELYKTQCKAASARQTERNRIKKEAEERYRDEYYRTHGSYPPSGSYNH